MSYENLKEVRAKRAKEESVSARKRKGEGSHEQTPAEGKAEIKTIKFEDDVADLRIRVDHI